MPELEDRLAAAIALIGRTGAEDFHLEHFTLEGREKEPVVWVTAAWWYRQGGRVRVVGAGNDPHSAAFRLLEQVIGGGECTHCHHPSGVDESLDAMPLDTLVCWYQYDPELKTYRRGCEDGS